MKRTKSRQSLPLMMVDNDIDDVDDKCNSNNDEYKMKTIHHVVVRGIGTTKDECVKSFINSFGKTCHNFVRIESVEGFDIVRYKTMDRVGTNVTVRNSCAVIYTTCVSKPEQECFWFMKANLSGYKVYQKNHRIHQDIQSKQKIKDIIENRYIRNNKDFILKSN